MTDVQIEGKPLDPNDILVAEYEYIAQTAFQANEDRARVTNFYLITLASFVAAILGTQFTTDSVTEVYSAFVVLFVVLAVDSVLTVLQLAQLRRAWFRSVNAMNQLKGYYTERFSDLQLHSAFAFNKGTLPARFAPSSVGFLLVLQTAVLGGACLGAAVIFFGLIWGVWWWWPAVGAALIACALQIGLYRRQVQKQ